MIEMYFTLAELAQRLPKSDKFWRAELKLGKFAPQVAGAADLSNIVSIGGEFMVPLSGVMYYLATHRLDGVVPGLVSDRLRPALVERGDLSGGVYARSPGELRRKRALQTSVAKETNGH